MDALGHVVYKWWKIKGNTSERIGKNLLSIIQSICIGYTTDTIK